MKFSINLQYHIRSSIVKLFLLSIALASAFVFLMVAADLPSFSDGSEHGDPSFLAEDGWKPLLNGSNLDGWQLVDPKKQGKWLATKAVVWGGTKDPTTLIGIPTPGDRIVNTDVDPKGNASNIYTTEKFGDVEFYIEFMIAAHSNAGVFMHGLYETQIWDSWGFTPTLETDQCGAMYHYNGGPINGIDGGITPKVRADRPPGQWQSYHYWFQAPRFDASGKKTANAKFLRILHNGQLIHENVERLGRTVATLDIPEAPTNPIGLQGDHGAVAFRNIYIRPLRPFSGGRAAPQLQPTGQAPMPEGRGARGAQPPAPKQP
jgi:hypothetical protein